MASDWYGARWWGAGWWRGWFAGTAVATPLMFFSALRTGNTVTLTLSNRVGPLEFDTETTPNPGNYGFSIERVSGPVVTILSVALSDDATAVEITLSHNPGISSSLRLHYTDGNLRDSEQACDDFDEAIERVANTSRGAFLTNRRASI